MRSAQSGLGNVSKLVIIRKYTLAEFTSSVFNNFVIFNAATTFILNFSIGGECACVVFEIVLAADTRGAVKRNRLDDRQV